LTDRTDARRHAFQRLGAPSRTAEVEVAVREAAKHSAESLGVSPRRMALAMTSPTSNDILDALRAVIDPEIGMNVVDLGLVYEAAVRDGDVHVALTMTTPTCPLGESICDEAERAIRQSVPGVKSVSVDLVREPPWQPSMMSTAARERLGWT
jgi:metal-sulfur cluster biosynthetic enzyme